MKYKGKKITRKRHTELQKAKETRESKIRKIYVSREAYELVKEWK